MVWPARRIWAARAVELLVALILSKFAIVAVLGLGGAALGHAFIPGIGSFLAGTTLVLLAAFSPWAMLRLLPLHELAGAAAGGLRPHAMHPSQAADSRAQEATDATEDVASRAGGRPGRDERGRGGTACRRGCSRSRATTRDRGRGRAGRRAGGRRRDGRRRDRGGAGGQRDGRRRERGGAVADRCAGGVRAQRARAI